MEKEKEMTDELKDYLLDPSKDYRQTQCGAWIRTGTWYG